MTRLRRVLQIGADGTDRLRELEPLLGFGGL